MTTYSLTPDQMITLYYGALQYQYSKILVRFPISSPLQGVTPSAARFKVYQDDSEANDLASVVAQTCTASWAESDLAATLDAMSLSGSLDSQDLPYAGGWRTFDVLGDASKGVQEACESSRTNITLLLTKAGYTEPSTTTDAVLRIGKSSDETVKAFAMSGIYAPVLEVDVDGVTTVLAMSAGVVV